MEAVAEVAEVIAVVIATLVALGNVGVVAVVTATTPVVIIAIIHAEVLVRMAANKDVQEHVKALVVAPALNFVAQIACCRVRADVFPPALRLAEMIALVIVQIFARTIARKDVKAAVLPPVDMAVDKVVLTTVL